MATVEFEGLCKRFGPVVAVEDVTLRIEDGEFVVLVGPSGCGKSTTLRMLAGLEPISSGNIKLDGRVVNTLAPKDRDIAMVFQSYALYPHMTVYKNMAFGLKMKGADRATIDRRVRDVAEMLNISALLDRKPRALSGGQRQRVAMGRALVRNPKAFLFDEPLSNLDAALRAQMRVEIKKLHRRLGTTIVYVTHDQIEAMTLADRIVLMKDGKVEQVDSPMAMFERPRTKFVAGFIGTPKMNFLPASLEAGGGGLLLRLSPSVALPIPASRAAIYELYVGKPVELGIRADHLVVGQPDDPASPNFEVLLEVVEPTGTEALAFFTFEGVELSARCSPRDTGLAGKSAAVTIDLDHMHLIDAETSEVVAVPDDGTAPERVVPIEQAERGQRAVR